jgi:hypothetical protein
VAVDRWAVQLAHFIRHLVEKEGIPKVLPDKQRGGISVLGWSKGVGYMMPLFANPHNFSSSLEAKELYELLVEYIKDIIFYGEE